MLSQQCMKTPQPDVFISRYHPSQWQSSEAGYTTPSALEPAANQGLVIAGGEPESLSHGQQPQATFHPSSQSIQRGHRKLVGAVSSVILSFPRSEMWFILQYLYSVLQCSRAMVGLVQNCSHLPCGDIFGYCQWHLKRKLSEWELEKCFLTWQRLTPNGQAVPRGGWCQQGSRRSWWMERYWSSLPSALQAKRDFYGPFFNIAKENRKVGRLNWEDITGFLLILISGQSLVGSSRVWGAGKIRWHGKRGRFPFFFFNWIDFLNEEWDHSGWVMYSKHDIPLPVHGNLSFADAEYLAVRYSASALCLLLWSLTFENSKWKISSRKQSQVITNAKSLNEAWSTTLSLSAQCGASGASVTVTVHNCEQLQLNFIYSSSGRSSHFSGSVPVFTNWFVWILVTGS